MSVINDDVLRSILTSKHRCNVSSIRILDWHIDDKILKAGNNYSTQVSRLTVRYQLPTQEHENDGPPQDEIFFLKVPNNLTLFEREKQWNSYDNEVAVYTQVLPQMYTIDDHDDDDDDECFSPKQYYFDDKNSLVLEDLSQLGYKCADRVHQLDFEHSFYALRSLAKFHALSVKLEKTVGLPEFVKRDPVMSPDGGWTDECTAAFQSQIPLFADSLPQNLKDRYPEMVTCFRNLSSPESMVNMANKLLTRKFNVLNHGDFWTNNIMFRYDKYDTIKNIKLIDFQLTSWSSPVKDLIFFTITSMKFEVYQNHFPLLLKIYLNTLNRVLNRFDCPTYSMSSLLDDIDALYPFTLAILACVLPMIISDPDDPIDIKEMWKDDKIEIEGMAKTYKQKHYREILEKWFEHFAQKGTLRIDEENNPNNLIDSTSSNDQTSRAEYSPQ